MASEQFPLRLLTVLAATLKLAIRLPAGRAQADVPILGAAGHRLRTLYRRDTVGNHKAAGDCAGCRLRIRIAGLHDHRVAFR